MGSAMAIEAANQDEDEPTAFRAAWRRWRLAFRVLKLGLGVTAFSVIAGSILAETSAQHGGMSKLAWFLTPSDREAMRRTAALALTGDIATGSVKLDPCALPKK